MTAAKCEKSEKEYVSDENETGASITGYRIETRWITMVSQRDVICIYSSFETTLSMKDLDNLLSVNHCQKE